MEQVIRKIHGNFELKVWVGYIPEGEDDKNIYFENTIHDKDGTKNLDILTLFFLITYCQDSSIEHSSSTKNFSKLIKDLFFEKMNSMIKYAHWKNLVKYLNNELTKESNQSLVFQLISETNNYFQFFYLEQFLTSQTDKEKCFSFFYTKIRQQIQVLYIDDDCSFETSNLIVEDIKRDLFETREYLKVN